MKFMTYSVGQYLFDAVLKVGDDPNFKQLNAVTQAAVMSARTLATDAAAEAQALKPMVDQARALHCTDDVEIDDYPVVSMADGGLWVSAWVWVQASGLED